VRVKTSHRLAVVVGLAVWASLGGQAEARKLVRPPTATVTNSRTDAAVDGQRLVGWGEPSRDGVEDARLVIFDDRTGARRSVSLGSACTEVKVIDATAGAFLVRCVMGSADPAYLVFESASTTIFPEREEFRSIYGYEHIGRHWLEGVDIDSHTTVFYRNWRTPEARYTGELPDYLRQPYDLDDPNLSPIGPERTYFIVGGAGLLAASEETNNPAIDLYRRGKPRVRLQHCDEFCTPIALKGGLAIWASGAYHGYALATKRRLAWKLPRGVKIRGATARRVYYQRIDEFGRVVGPLRSFRWR
jgi:hypothetical protein